MPWPAWFLLLALIAAGAAGVHHVSPANDGAISPDIIDANGTEGVLLERYLWQQGLYPVIGIGIGGRYIDWEDVARRSLWYVPALILPDGGISLFGERLASRDIAVVTSHRPERSVLDVAPTVGGALGLGGNFDGKDLCSVNVSQVVVINVDGVGWCRYLQAKSAMKNLSSLGPAPACSVYPSISNVNAAAMLTGLLPEHSGIDHWGMREIGPDNIVSLALKNGVSAAWVDGPRPTVFIRPGTIKVDDTNGDGSWDDEIAVRAAAEYDKGTRLLYVHLFDTDRTLHAYGPCSAQSLDSATHADILIGYLAGRMRPGTLLLVIADHGGHEITGGRGDHGSLVPRDMLIPMAVRVC
jgi:Type I phosphodiesterase / nucleotide pyrophosphatase